MMMEEETTGDMSASVDVNAINPNNNNDDDDDDDSTSRPPSFAVPPGGMHVDTATSSEDDGQSVTPPPSTNSTTEEPTVATAAAAADPFDLLSMTSPAAPASALPTTTTLVANGGTTVDSSQQTTTFDVFDSDPSGTDTMMAAPVASTTNVGDDDFLMVGMTTNNTTEIDITAQESMIASRQSPSTKATTNTNPRQLMTAESGDLLGLCSGGDAAAGSELQQPPNDFMDSDFQTLPVTVADTTAIDPFDEHPRNNNNNNKSNLLVATANASVRTTTLTAIPSKLQPQEEKEQQVQPSQTSESNSVATKVASKDATNAAHQEDTKTDPSTQHHDGKVESDHSKGEEMATKTKEEDHKDTANTPPQEDVTTKEASEKKSAVSKGDQEQVLTEPDEGTPGTPSQAPREVYDETETSMFEEVELASPQESSSAVDNESAKAALARQDLKPPLLDSATNNINATKDPSSISSTAPSANQPPPPRHNEMQEAKVEELEEKLAKALQQMEDMKKQKQLMEQQQQDSQAETATVLQELQTRLQEEVSQRAEAENDVHLAKREIQQLSTTLEEKETEWKQQSEEWKQQLSGLEKENEALIEKAKQELQDRKEHERRERVLANKLNMVKKQQATKTDVEEVYEDDLRLLKDEVAAKTKQVQELEASQVTLKEELEKEKAVSQTRIEQLEKAVREEKNLNEERKKKMKAFIDSKADELREAKEESERYETELNQTNQSLVDLNSRWKTLHAQWVQSQTRNRELQRDLNKIKKDSENLHKVGDSLNVKLSRSANETEQHKSKRLAAKQELMSVLGQLEAEREITNKLRDSVRFTFTAKAQSQHQLLQENLTEFHKQLEALARRLGRPIPLTNDGGSQSLSSLVMAAVDESEASESGDFAAASATNGGQDDKTNSASKEQRRVLLETTRLLGKLEIETQHISQGIMALTSGIEQMNQLIQGGGEKTCFTSLGDILFGGGLAKAIEADRGTNSNRSAGGRPPVRYGHSSHLPTAESGTMT